MVRFILAAAVAFSITITVTVPANAFQFIEATPVFSTAVPSPYLGAICMKRLWVFSEETKAITALDPAGGRVIKTFTPIGRASAISCVRETLVVAAEPAAKGSAARFDTYEINANAELAKTASRAAPAKGRINDVKCNDGGCVALIENKIFKSKNLLKWDEVVVPVSPEIERSDIDLKSNPFDGWSDRLLLAHGRYSKLALPADGKELLLLDPIRASVVKMRGGVLTKWGGWGVWEGRLLAPKSVTETAAGRIVISDTGLKTLFVFNGEGGYLGALSVKKTLTAPRFAPNILSDGERIYVLDVAADTVAAYDLPAAIIPPEAAAGNDDFVRGNLFRREEVLNDRIRFRCLNCHDGTVNNQLDKYVGKKITHPVNVSYHHKTQLPLEGDDWITCSTCHNAHHGTLIPSGDKDVPTPEKAPFLRKDFRGLCLECHADRAEVHANHPDPKGETCAQCHTAHGEHDHLLKKQETVLCLSCHKAQGFNHRPVEDLSKTERAKGLRLDGGQIACLTCHSPHLLDKDAKKILRPADSVLPLCVSCHGDQAEKLYTGFHKRLRRK